MILFSPLYGLLDGNYKKNHSFNPFFFLSTNKKLFLEQFIIAYRTERVKTFLMKWLSGGAAGNLMTDGGEVESAECVALVTSAGRGRCCTTSVCSLLSVCLSVSVISPPSGVSAGRRQCTGVSHAKVYTTEPHNNLFNVYKERKCKSLCNIPHDFSIFSSFC